MDKETYSTPRLCANKHSYRDQRGGREAGISTRIQGREMLDRTTDWGNLKINTYAPPNVSLRLLNCGRRLSDVPGGFKVSTTGGLEAEQ